MLVRIFFFVIIVIVILSAVLNIKQNNNENFTDTKKLHYDGSVHLKGDVLVNNIPNKIRTKQLCFRNDEGKEECLDTGQFSFALNNSSERNYLKCLGEVCIDNNHIDILKNKHNFNLKNIKQNKCYMMRDTTLHGLGGNYAGLRDSGLNSIGISGDKRRWGIRKLRGGYRGARYPSYGLLYNEHMPGKPHNDCGDYWRYWRYADGGSENSPFIPNFVVAENCDLETDPVFKKYENTQQKNQFRFIKADLSDRVEEIEISGDTPALSPSGKFSGPMPGPGLSFGSD
tara:strand:- start:325 stop:1179 length:855 start_codon:yes stop_codon:yes gene_type:complete